MKKSKVMVISAITFIIIIWFVMITLVKTGVFSHLNADVSNIVNNNDLNISFKKNSNTITIENTDNKNFVYQVVETDFNIVNSVKETIRNRDHYIDSYNKYISNYKEQLSNIDQDSEEAKKLNEYISKFENGINDQITICNEKINSLIPESISLSDSNWIELNDNKIVLEQDNKDKLVFVKDFNNTYVYYSIDSKPELSADLCEVSEDYLKYLSLSSEEKKSFGIVPEICASEEDSTRSSDDIGELPNKYPSNFGTNEFFETTVENMKNQMTTPFCTAFATTASLESYLYRTTGKVYTFSERYAAYKMTTPFSHGRVNPIGVRTALDGGFSEIEMAKFLGYYGPVYDEEMPMINSMDAIDISEIDRDPVVDINEIYVKNETNDIVNKIKESVYTYGDVAISISYDKAYLYNGSFYNNVDTTTDHAVTVIGWDDNYPKENFNPERRPSSNGALIIKNSYGNEMQGGINGYFYLSYEDTSLSGYFSVRDVDFDFSDNQYFYDFGGDLGTVSSFTYNGYNHNLLYQAIKLNVGNYNEHLTKIKYTMKTDSNVEFYLAKSNDTISGGVVLKTISRIGEVNATAGVHTYELDEPIQLNLSSGIYYVVMKSDVASSYFQKTPSTSTSSRDNLMFISDNGTEFYDTADMYLSPMLAAYTDVIETPSNDSTKPKVSLAGGGIQNKEGAEVTLRCSDNVGVTGYYFGTSNPSLNAMTTTTGLDDITSEGLRKTGLTDGTYYFGCRDEKGNYDVDSMTIDKFNLVDVVEKLNGNKDYHNTNNYEVRSQVPYYIRKNGLVTACQRQQRKNGSLVYNYAKGFNPPEEVNNFLGYSTSTISSNLSFDPIAININNQITLYMWYDRKTYEATIKSEQDGSITASTTNQSNNSVTVNSNSTDTLTVKHGDTISLTASPSSGYHLTSWSGGYVSGSEESVIGPVVTDAVRVIGTFSNQALTHTVTFKIGSNIYGDVQNVPDGGTATKPTDPGKVGYVFNYWSLEENGSEYNFNTPVTGDIVLHAVYTKETYTITFNTHGGSEIESQTVTHGGKATQPTPPTRTGYNFIRWSLTENGTESYDFNTQVTKSITIHAVWTQNSIQIKDETNMYRRDDKFYVRPTELLYIDKNTIFNNLVSTSGVNIYDKDNNVVSDGTASIATGYKISSGETNYTIIIYGDIDLDGTVTSNDLRLEYNHITAGFNLGNLSLSAADFDGDGIVGVNDLRNIYVLITH